MRMRRTTLLQYWLRALLLLGLLGGGVPGHAQQPAGPPGFGGPPPGGFPLRVTRQLARVPEPPGGLLPFRHGQRWGFADSTGRVWIQPELLEAPAPLVDGFVGLPLWYFPQFIDSARFGPVLGWNEPLKHISPVSDWLLQRRFRRRGALLNARGEILLIGRRRVLLVRPDSSLRTARRAWHRRQPRLAADYRWQFTPAGPVPHRYYEPRQRPARPDNYRRGRLGEGYYARWRYQRLRLVYRVRFKRDQNRTRYFFFQRETLRHYRVALFDSSGHRLTPRRYLHIELFHEHRALAELRRLPGQRRRARRFPSDGARLVFLDRRGRELALPAGVTVASPFAQGAAVGWAGPARGYAAAEFRRGVIIDTLGRLLLPFTDSLSALDAAGLLRVAEAGRTRFLTRRGEPAFANHAFRRAGPFYHGRAWVQAFDGRQGLINPRGQWVTPLRYELLTSATRRYPFRRDFAPAYTHGAPLRPDELRHALPNWLPPDTAYMLCRRAGKYGFVARRTGREVIPARYDSVRFHLADGVACLYRGGQAYVVNAQGRELVQAEYRGDWYDYSGHPLHVFRPATARWTVIDTSGRRRLPWLPGTGYYTPDGRALVELTPADSCNELYAGCGYRCAGLLDSAGHVLLPFGYGLTYAGTHRRLHLGSIMAAQHRPLELESYPSSAEPSQVYLLPTPTAGTRLLRARDLQPFTPGTFDNLRLLAGNWHLGRRRADSLSVLIDPRGRQHAAPRGTTWLREHRSEDYPPFQRGPEPVRPNRPADFRVSWPDDYVTRGGQPLWDDTPIRP